MDQASDSQSDFSETESLNSQPDDYASKQASSDEEDAQSEEAESDSSSEEKEEEFEGSSARFTNLIRKVIALNNYPEDPIVTKNPELRSNQSLPRPEIYRLPPSNYFLDKAEQMRAELESASAKSYDKKLFFRPPAALNRVAETGDKLKNTGKPGKPKMRLVREIPPTPQAFYDILSDKREQAAVPKSKVHFAPPEARAQELSMQWALKAANYHDHLTHLLQNTQGSAEEQVAGLSAWLSTTTSDIPPDVKTTIKTLQSDLATAKAASSECKHLLQSMVDTLLYVKSMFELARRDDLLNSVSRDVEPPTRRALRLSVFDGQACFEQKLCELGYAQCKEAKKNRSSKDRPSFPSGSRRNNQRFNHKNQPNRSSSNRSFSNNRGGGNRFQGNATASAGPSTGGQYPRKSHKTAQRGNTRAPRGGARGKRP